jgi:hypothetical protein
VVYSDGEALLIDLDSGRTIASFDGFAYSPLLVGRPAPEKKSVRPDDQPR